MKAEQKRSQTMDRMLVIVFYTESKDYEGREALLALDDDGRMCWSSGSF